MMTMLRIPALTLLVLGIAGIASPAHADSAPVSVDHLQTFCGEYPGFSITVTAEVQPGADVGIVVDGSPTGHTGTIDYHNPQQLDVPVGEGTFEVTVEGNHQVVWRHTVTVSCEESPEPVAAEPVEVETTSPTPPAPKNQQRAPEPPKNEVAPPARPAPVQHEAEPVVAAPVAKTHHPAPSPSARPTPTTSPSSDPAPVEQPTEIQTVAQADDRFNGRIATWLLALVGVTVVVITGSWVTIRGRRDDYQPKH